MSIETEGLLRSLHVGRPRQFEHNGRPAVSAIWKARVTGRVAVEGINIAGDEQADRGAHGGPDKAVYAYAVEDYRWWETQLERSLEDAQFGENLTTEGIDVTNAVVGELWEIGTVTLEVSEPRVPCWRLGVRMEDARFVKRFTGALRPGTYLRIVREGELGAGDAVHIVDRPDHGLTIGDMFRIYAGGREEAERILAVPQMSSAWRAWAQRVIDKRKAPEHG